MKTAIEQPNVEARDFAEIAEKPKMVSASSAISASPLRSGLRPFTIIPDPSCCPLPLPLLPGTLIDGRPATLGVLGGGQLGRMFVHAAQALGYDGGARPRCRQPGRAREPAPSAPITAMATRLTGWRPAHAVTTEFENVPADSLAPVSHASVSPPPTRVAIAQDRGAERRISSLLRRRQRCGPGGQRPIATEAELAAVPAALLPGILKTARLGYDGKGQARVATRAELAAAWQAMGCVPCVLEQRCRWRWNAR